MRAQALPVLGLGLAVTVMASACGGSSKAPSGAGGSAGYAPIPAGPIKVGQIYPLSGPYAAFGTSAKASTAFFVDELNQAGGIDGHQVQLFTGDDKADPATGVTEAQRLMQQQHISVMLEPGFSAEALQIVPVLTRAKVPTFASLPEHELADASKYPYYFDFYPLDPDIGTEMVKYAKTLGVTKLGIARDSSPYGDSYLPSLKEEAGKVGVTIVDTESFDPAATDVSTQIRKLKGAGAEGVAVLAVGPVVGHVYQAMHTLGWSPKIVGTGALNTSGADSLGSLKSNAFYGCGVAAASKSSLPDGIKKAVAKLNAKFGPLPRQHVTLLYGRDSIWALKAAVEKYHSLDPDAIKKAVEAMSGVSFTDPSLRYTFSPTLHAGFPASEVRMCNLSELGPESTPVFAANS